MRGLRARGARLWQAARTSAPERPRIGGALDEIDDEFHAAYERARADVAQDDPVFVVLANELVLFHCGLRRAWSFSPRAYHVIKQVSHTPLAIFASLEPGRAQEPAEHALGRRRALEDWIDDASRELARERDALGAQTSRDLETVLATSQRLLRSAHDKLTPDDAARLARELGPVLLRLIDRATELQLRALDVSVEAALTQLTHEQIARLQVVVTGNHQARVRSLPMQYFRARMREPEGVERHVTYAESVSSEQDALALVGTRKLDRAIAQAFFGDPARMQRDLLGDSAHARLAASNVRPIDGF